MLRIGIPLALVSISLIISSCGSGGKTTAAAPPPPIVEITEIHPQDVPIFSEYAAETYARDQVEVRGRVDGYIEKRLFQIGSDVQAGQNLYVLDLRPYQADVAHAQGQVAHSEAALDFAKKQVSRLQADADLAQAEANLIKARQDVDRLIPLVKQDAAAQQDLDNARAALDANQANVNAKKANVDQSRISTDTQIASAQAQLQTDQAALKTTALNLEYATIQAPISGRIGDSLVQVGGLVSRNSPQPLTTIVPLDPIWVRFKVSESEYLNLQRRNSQDRTLEAPLELILADGSTFPSKGRVENTVNAVDSKTGTLELQAKFPNPQHTVLPGQFGRIRLAASVRKEALLVPQRAVSDLQGLQAVFTVGDDNKAVSRNVVTGERVGENWVIQQGLKPGDKVIVEGLQRVRPGVTVNPKPYHSSDNAGK